MAATNRPRSRSNSSSSSSSSSTPFALLCSAAENFCTSSVPCMGGQDAADEVVREEIMEREEEEGTRREAADDIERNVMAGSDNDDQQNNISESNLVLESYNSLLVDGDAHDADETGKSRPPQSQAHYRGLHNLGNTCYINSSLQVLMTLESFVDDVVSRTAHCGELTCGGDSGGADGNDDNEDAGHVTNNDTTVVRGSAYPLNGTPPRHNGTRTLAKLGEAASSRGVVAEGRRRLPSLPGYDTDSIEEEKKEEETCDDHPDNDNGGISPPPPNPAKPLHAALGNVFTNLRNTSGSNTPVTTDDAAVNLSDFKSAIDSHAPQFVGFEQQDSHEFIGTLLDLLDEEVKTRDREAKAVDTAAKVGSNKDGEKEDKNVDIMEEGSPSEALSTSPQKRKRSSSPSSLSSSSPSLVSEEEDDGDSSDGMPRTRSFADLTVKDISSLLHGNDDTEAVSNNVDEVEIEPTETNESDASKNPSSPVSQFTTEVRTTLTCNSCKFSRSKTEMFRCLSLDVAAGNAAFESNNPTNIEECLQRFFSSEQRDVKCEKCFFDTATQTSKISRLPRALLLHFKRFVVDVSPDYSSVSYKKDTRQVEFVDKIFVTDDNAGGDAQMEGPTSLADYLASDCVLPSKASMPTVYKLRGIVNHIGKRADKGHYTAVTFTGRPKSGDKSLVWTKFNDECVVPISAEDALGKDAQATAYILLYSTSEQQGKM